MEKFKNWVIGYIKYLFSGIRTKQIALGCLLICTSSILLVYLYNYWIDVAKIGIFAIVASIGIIMLSLVDIVILKDIDTHEAIKEKNRAYMDYIKSVAFIIGCCILAFFK